MNTFFVFTVLLACGQIAYMFPTSMEKEIEDLTLPEQGEDFEGDILLTEEQIQDMQTNRNGQRDESFRWPDATLVYRIDGDFNDEQLQTIREAMDLISSQTCVTFKERTNEENYAVILHPSKGGCNSYIGMIGGAQEVNYPDWCLRNGPGSPAHELIHALGFFHAQSASNRDDYVRINWENIDTESHKHNFRKESEATSTDFGVGYDYDSVMHYSATGFGKKLAGRKRAETITVLQKGAPRIGQRDHLSEKDIAKIKKMYNCA